MGLAPAFRVEIDGRDVTIGLKARGVEISITDEAEFASDTLSLTVFDEGDLRIPKPGQRVKAWLGYGDEIQYFGEYVVSDVEVSSDRIVVGASGFDALSELKSVRNKSYGGTIKSIVSQIASQYALEARVEGSLGEKSIELLQANESDLHFLTRVCLDFHAQLRINDGKLIVKERGTGLSVSGRELDEILLAPEDVSPGWRVRFDRRESYSSVVASWRDLLRSEIKTVRVGSGDPAFTIKKVFASRDFAEAAAAARFASLTQAQASFLFSGPGNPRLRAERIVRVVDFRPGIPERWFVTRAEHTLGDGGYRVSVSCEVME